jgi:hypothetical protein
MKTYSSMSVKELRAVFRIIDVQPSPGVGGPDKIRLGGVIWHRQTGSAAILVDSSFADNTLDMIAVFDSGAQSFQYNGCETLTSSITIGVGIPHTTPPCGREHIELTLDNIHALENLQR